MSLRREKRGYEFMESEGGQGRVVVRSREREEEVIRKKRGKKKNKNEGGRNVKYFILMSLRRQKRGYEFEESARVGVKKGGAGQED